MPVVILSDPVLVIWIFSGKFRTFGSHSKILHYIDDAHIVFIFLKGPKGWHKKPYCLTNCYGSGQTVFPFFPLSLAWKYSAFYTPSISRGRSNRNYYTTMKEINLCEYCGKRRELLTKVRLCADELPYCLHFELPFTILLRHSNNAYYIIAKL